MKPFSVRIVDQEKFFRDPLASEFPAGGYFSPEGGFQ
jgi:hypothetical protein